LFLSSHTYQRKRKYRQKEKTANAVFSLYLSILFFANLFDNNNRKSEEDESHSPHDNTAENAAKAYAQACNNVGYSSDARNERSVGELSINVVNVVAFLHLRKQG
jgi:hypothetical protein